MTVARSGHLCDRVGFALEPFQVKIADLAARTGLDFGELASHDPLVVAGREIFKEGAAADVVAIAGLSDVVL